MRGGAQHTRRRDNVCGHTRQGPLGSARVPELANQVRSIRVAAMATAVWCLFRLRFHVHHKSKTGALATNVDKLNALVLDGDGDNATRNVGLDLRVLCLQ